MATRRGRSADREGDRLSEVLERLAGRPVMQPPVQQFRAPQYSGQGDVEYFITRFEEVAEANEWRHGAALLHLRDALRETAEDCGRAANVPAIFAALRARFGLSPREARTRLSALKKEFRTPLQEHAAEVERLVNIAYADLPQEHRASMRVEIFGNTLGYLPLQRHLLAVHTPTLEDAVRAGNEFLQIRPANEKGSTSVRQVEDEEEEEDSNPTGKVLTTLLKAMQQLMEKMGQFQQLPTRSSQKGDPNKERLCWGCGKSGHLKRNCPLQKAAQVTETPASGNGSGPPQ